MFSSNSHFLLGVGGSDDFTYYVNQYSEIPLTNVHLDGMLDAIRCDPPPGARSFMRLIDNEKILFGA